MWVHIQYKQSLFICIPYSMTQSKHYLRNVGLFRPNPVDVVVVSGCFHSKHIYVVVFHCSQHLIAIV